MPRNSGGGFGSTNAGVIGGLLMIVVAAIWFGVGYYNGIIFFYPPFLAIFGLVAIVRAIFSR